MLNANELLFTVDKNNIPVTPQIRKKVHANNLWHRTTGIWVYNKKKGILCQKRSLKKDKEPGFWEAYFGGHLLTNEDYSDNATSELSEELGIPVQKENMKFYKLMKSPKITHKEYQAVYLYELKNSDSEFSFEKDEIDRLEWVSIDVLFKILISNKDSHWVHKPWDKDMLALIKKNCI